MRISTIQALNISVQILILKVSSIHKNKYFKFVYRGPDFRPDYGKLGVLTALFPNVPTAALTATATLSDRKEIMKALCMWNQKQVIGSLDQA